YSTHIYGCRVIQELLINCTNVQRTVLTHELTHKVSGLCRHQYGNYVIQKVLEMEENQKLIALMVQGICDDIDTLVFDKFSSNVVEKCLFLLQGEPRLKLVCSILYPQHRKKREGYLSARMVCDQYANYIIQTLLTVTTANYRKDLVRQLQESVTPKELLKFSWGKQILGKIRCSAKNM
ncbi:hypothetical protein RFI_22096, partial [Reticulomyxa filosa]